MRNAGTEALIFGERVVSADPAMMHETYHHPINYESGFRITRFIYLTRASSGDVSVLVGPNEGLSALSGDLSYVVCYLDDDTNRWQACTSHVSRAKACLQSMKHNKAYPRQGIYLQKRKISKIVLATIDKASEYLPLDCGLLPPHRTECDKGADSVSCDVILSLIASHQNKHLSNAAALSNPI